MTVSVQTAIYRLKYEGLDEAYKAAAALGKVEVAEEKLTRATRASAAGFERTLGTLDPAIMAYQRYQQALEKVTRWETAGIGTAQQRNHLVEQATQRYAAATAALGRVGVANDNMSKKVGLGAHEMRNLSYQVNDVATMLASGSSPFQVLATQGGQFYQILSGANGGITGALKGLFASLMAFLGPLGLLAVGVAAVAAAAYGLYSYLKTEGPTAEKLLTEHDRLLKIVKDSYDKVTNSAKNWYEQSKAVTQLQLLQQEIDLRQKLNAEVGKAISKSTTFGGIGDFIAGAKTVKQDLLPFEDAIFRLQDGFKQGVPNVKAFQDEVAQIALLNPALQKLGVELVNGVGDASKFQQALLQIKAALNLIEGGKPTEEDRGRLGLPAATRAQVNGYDQLIQRTKDRIEEMKLEATSAGQTAGAVMQLKLQHDAERAAKQAGVQVNQKVLDQLKEEMVATDRLLKLKNIRSEIDFDRQTTGLSQQDVQIASRLRGIYPDVATSLGSVEAAEMRVVAGMQHMSDICAELGSNLLRAFADGKSGLDALLPGLSAVGNKMASIGGDSLKSGISGMVKGLGTSGFDPVSLGIGVAGIGIQAITGWLGAADEAEQKLEESKRRFKEMGTQVIAFNAAAAGMELGPLTQQLNSLHSSFMSLVNAAAEAEDWAAVQRLQQSLNRGVQRTVNEFINGAEDLSPLEQSMKAVRDEASGLKETLDFLGFMTADVGRSIDGALIRRLEEVKRASDEAAAAAGRARAAGFGDQLFDLTNDTSTVAGQLAALERETARLREQEIKDGGQAMADLDALYFARRNKIISDFNQQAIDNEKRAAEERAAAQNSAARNILDYVNGLLTGSGSGGSPTSRFNNAQAVYGSQLALAQGGNIDAQNRITQDFENYKIAARDLYGSTATFQAILNQGIQDLLNLPAVQSTADPVLQTMRDVLAAIQAGTATQSTDAVLIGTLLPAINQGNATATATALSTFFNKIDTNTSQTIDYAEMLAALGNANLVTNTNLTASDIATRDRLQAIFATLDADGDSQISRLELIRASSQATQGSTAQTSTNVGNVYNLTADANNIASYAANIANNQTTLLDAIRSFTNTSAEQLILLRTALNPGAINLAVSSAAGNGTNINVTLNNQMVEALNKIVFNTWAISRNTAFQIDVAARAVGVYATGGLVTGPGTGTSDSINARLSNGEYVSTAETVTRLGVGFFDQLAAGRMPVAPIAMPYSAANDNSAIIRALMETNRALIARLDRLEATLARATIAGAQHVGSKVEEVRDATQEATREAMFRAA